MSASQRYEVFESLGQNDCLTVYRGWDRRLGRPVAIMELEERFRAKEHHYDRVWDEVLAVAGLEHQGFVRVYEVEKRKGWIVTELMTGTLSGRITKSGLSNREVRGVLKIGLEALAYLHERSKLHGDIRPADLLIDEDGHVRLSHPVGLAVGGQVPRRTMNQKYLAPELVKPEFGEPGNATDLYCLGFAAYELLAGPALDETLKGASLGTVASGAAGLGWLRWHASEEPFPPLKDIVPGVAGDLAATIDVLVRKSVAERPENAADAIKLLSSTEDDDVVFAPDVSAPKPERPNSPEPYRNRDG